MHSFFSSFIDVMQGPSDALLAGHLRLVLGDQGCDAILNGHRQPGGDLHPLLACGSLVERPSFGGAGHIARPAGAVVQVQDHVLTIFRIQFS